IRLFRELVDQVGDEPRPTGLVRCATAAAIVAVEIFMEQDVILEMRIGLKFLVAAENRAPAICPAQKKLEQASAQLVCDLVERAHDAGAGRTFDLEPVAVEQIEPA